MLDFPIHVEIFNKAKKHYALLPSDNAFKFGFANIFPGSLRMDSFWLNHEFGKGFRLSVLRLVSFARDGRYNNIDVLLHKKRRTSTYIADGRHNGDVNWEFCNRIVNMKGPIFWGARSHYKPRSFKMGNGAFSDIRLTTNSPPLESGKDGINTPNAKQGRIYPPRLLIGAPLFILSFLLIGYGTKGFNERLFKCGWRSGLALVLGSVFFYYGGYLIFIEDLPSWFLRALACAA